MNPKDSLSQLLESYRGVQEKPSYDPKHRLTLPAWDKHVEDFCLLDSIVGSLNKKVTSFDSRIAKLEQQGSCTIEKIKQIEQETWQTKLINYAYTNKCLTVIYLAAILGILVSIATIVK